jgi:glyoxylase-like metal-dependent hydrolase (beta-lactamase superfamily II)
MKNLIMKYPMKNPFKKLSFSLLLILSISQSAWADGKLELKEVEKNIYAIVGDLTNRTPKNLGNTATFGVVVTDKGVVLIDAGGTYSGAKQIHTMIKTITDKPIVKVINTGGQDHRWLGNDYFKKLGAEIIASDDAVKDQKARKDFQFLMLSNLVGEKEVKLTDPVHADKTFEKELNFKLGDIEFEISHIGQAHTPGDSFVWLPQSKVMFTGDIVYTERMLGVLDHSNSKSWLTVFEAMASHKPKHIIPGHGHPTTLEKAKKDTYDYLVSLRSGVTQFIEDDGDLSEISKVDQSKFDYLFNHKTLSGRNAQQVFTEMEWE